jgi:hypothetical protein
MCTNPVIELLPGYTLDCLDEVEQNFVSEHLDVCAGCRTEAHAYRAVIAQLAFTAPEADPPPNLKRRLLNRIQRTSLSSG